ncbi:MAG: adenine deaminase C-terminal domain-containing protein [Muribaculaceae bacterium]
MLLREMLYAMHFRTLTASDFQLQGASKRNAIAIVDGQLLTKRVAVDDAGLKACNLLATVERHGKNGNIAVCPLIGYGIKNGAVATSVAHDSHNVICAGDNAEDMAVACNRLKEIAGGYVIASGGKVVDEFPLTCCGLMSEVGVDDAIAGISRLEVKAHELGVNPNIDQFITLSFLALPVIPDIRLLDTGLFDVTKSRFIK